MFSIRELYFRGSKAQTANLSSLLSLNSNLGTEFEIFQIFLKNANLCFWGASWEIVLARLVLSALPPWTVTRPFKYPSERLASGLAITPMNTSVTWVALYCGVNVKCPTLPHTSEHLPSNCQLCSGEPLEPLGSEQGWHDEQALRFITSTTSCLLFPSWLRAWLTGCQRPPAACSCPPPCRDTPHLSVTITVNPSNHEPK